MWIKHDYLYYTKQVDDCGLKMQGLQLKWCIRVCAVLVVLNVIGC